MIRGFFLAMILVVLGYAFSFFLFVSLLPPTPGEIPRADGIVALTGGGERLDAAASLFEQGVGRRLLISGVGLVTTKDTLKDITHGGSRFECCADIGYAAEDTHGNAVETAEWARSHGFTSLVIVTARYHMPRALRELQHAMPDVELKPYPVDQDRIDLAGWWRHGRTTLLLHNEYVKYLASLVTTSVSG
jgi:uncharacterized SAM-binding protein YcdF (DUF218 family)